MAVWLSTDEIMQKPTSGAAWDALKKQALAAWGTAKVSDQNSLHDVSCLAGALYATRMNDNTIRTKTANGCKQAIGTEAGGRTLALGRNLAAYVAAADTIGFRDPAFVSWVDGVLERTLDGMTLKECHERRANNWGCMAGMSRIAADIYLGDTSDLERAATVYQGWLGDRAKYAAFKYGGMEWQADTSKPVGINPKGSVKNGKPVDGCMPDDQRRGGGFEWPPPAENYVRGSLGPCLVAIEMLRRNGYPSAPAWSDRALDRCLEFFTVQCKGTFSGDDAWEPFLARKLYGADAAPGGSPSTMGKPWGWTAFTHA